MIYGTFLCMGESCDGMEMGNGLRREEIGEW